MDAFQLFTDEKCDGFVSIGAGSSTDCTKGYEPVCDRVEVVRTAADRGSFAEGLLAGASAGQQLRRRRVRFLADPEALPQPPQ